jgi:hypothetical protein
VAWWWWCQWKMKRIQKETVHRHIESKMNENSSRNMAIYHPPTYEEKKNASTLHRNHGCDVDVHSSIPSIIDHKSRNKQKKKRKQITKMPLSFRSINHQGSLFRFGWNKVINGNTNYEDKDRRKRWCQVVRIRDAKCTFCFLSSHVRKEWHAALSFKLKTILYTNIPI